MKRSRSPISLRNAIDAYCHECGAPEAGSNWREHVAVCPCTSCPMWPVRPLSANAPDWMKSRNPTGAPGGWTNLSREVALSQLRNVDVESPGMAKTAILETSRQRPASDSSPKLKSSQNSQNAVTPDTIGVKQGSNLRGTR